MKHLKRFLIFILVVVVVLVVTNIVPWAPSGAKTNKLWIREQGEMPLIIPHGGAKETYPENTMYAFDKTSHFDAFEIDLALTSDDILISHHDLDLKLMAGRADLLVRDYTYNDLINAIKDQGFPHVRNFNGSSKKEDYSSWTDQEILDAKLIPVPLEEVFQKYPDKLYILELKNTFRKTGDKDVDKKNKEVSDLAVTQLINLIDKYHMHEKVLMASFDDSMVKSFNKVSKDKVGTIGGSVSSAIFTLTSYFKVDFFYYSNYESLSLPYREKLGGSTLETMKKFPGFIQNILATKDEDGNYWYDMHRYEFQRDAQRKGIAVIYWTVNDRTDMVNLIKRGVDGIITDNPDLLQELINLYK